MKNNKEKLWSECSKEEHSEIKKWNKKRKELKRKYFEDVKELLIELDEIERKYR